MSGQTVTGTAAEREMDVDNMTPEMRLAAESFGNLLIKAAELAVEKYGHLVAGPQAAQSLSVMCTAVASGLHGATGADPKACGELAKVAVFGAIAKRFKVAPEKYREWLELSGRA